MNTEQITSKVLPFKRPPTARLEVVSADERLEVQAAAPGTLTVLGYLPDDGPFDAFIALKVDGNFVTVAVHKGMSKEDIFDAFSNALPPGYEAATADSQSEVLILTVLKVRPRVSGNPTVKFMSNDPAQSLRWVGENKFTLSGSVSRAQTVRSFVEVTVDEKPLRIFLAAGESALAVATRIRAALPSHYQAILELPLYGEDQVKITVLRRVAH
ncbi:MAG: hypothetical protein ACYC8T_20610 [Myxococcaceae bacterium]